jgi:epoxyqueuosine reductase
LAELLGLTDEEFRSRFQGTSIMRAMRVGLQKNVCVALGNGRARASVPALIAALKNTEPLVRGHAAWALGQIATDEAVAALEQSIDSETDGYIVGEIAGALRESSEGEPTSQPS